MNTLALEKVKRFPELSPFSNWEVEHNPALVIWCDAMSSEHGPWGAKTFERRREVIGSYGFAVPSRPALQAIIDNSPHGVLEIGAGTGYWASLLAKLEADVVAYDSYEGHYTDALRHGAHFPIRKGDGRQAVRDRAHDSRTLFMSWPDYDVSWPAEVLEAYEGNTVVYVGESSGGCTGDDRFHQILSDHWTSVAEVAIPTWPGIHDGLEIFTRKIVKKINSIRVLSCPSCGGALPDRLTSFVHKCDFCGSALVVGDIRT